MTRVDHDAILRARGAQPRSRGLMGWLAGDYQAEAPADAPGTLAPPADDVRREMLRLELAAQEAEARARRAEMEAALAEAGIPIPDAASDVEPGATPQSGTTTEAGAATGPGTTADSTAPEANPDPASDPATAAS